MYKVGKPYYVGIITYKEDDQEDVDVLCLVDSEEKMEEVFQNTGHRINEKYNASVSLNEERHKKYVSKDKNVEIEVFFVERMLTGRRNEIQTN